MRRTTRACAALAGALALAAPAQAATAKGACIKLGIYQDNVAKTLKPLTKAVGKDLARTGVVVNCVAPAVIETPILEGISQEHIGYMVERIPMGRMGTPDEVAALVCWLASEECSFSTGATYDISGGRAVY